MSDTFRPVDWIYSSNIYEVNLRQYTPEGTIKAFSRELPRLRDMGIDVLWFMPITPISAEKRIGSLGSYYACSDYTSINPEYGTMEDFIALVKEAHTLGFRVILDIVANHTGWDHHWTREHPDYYRRNQEGQFYDPHGWADVIDLNYDNPRLRQAMIDVMRFWIGKCDVDGFRCDMAMLVPLDFWREARQALDPLKPLFWLAECEEIAYHEVFDATYTWKLLHKMEAVWRTESPVAGLDEVLEYYDTMFPDDGLRVYFTTNHDENSHSGSEFERMGGMARAFAVLCCTWNGLPLIYSGQELPNYKRLKFFDKDQIDWTGRYEMHGFYRTLLQLRKRNPALRSGDPAVTLHRLHTSLDDRSFVFARRAGDDLVLVVLNLSAAELTLPVAQLLIHGSYREAFTGTWLDLPAAGNLVLPGWGYAVYEKTK
ncbi:alpha-amylase family glycosyl hydrolase [Puia dinghuensis]|uniref:Alpha-amlyase n=1 Tax=Puia dinghuensis TaxID=1792502 RepID=A0A8J2UIS5_9BACT|nr:alpha-amylase family glycosyl hydrolase [Puia dinghuensis]GGB22024.1 alpha-amlyase [Puia dinghuensis]